MSRNKFDPGPIPIQLLNQGNPAADISEIVPQKCAVCGGEFFIKVFRVGIIPQFAPKNRTGQELRGETPTLICHACGHEFGSPKNITPQ